MSSSNPYGPLLGEDEQQSEEQPSPQQPRSRPGRVLTPNTRTAYAARASARRAALRDHNPDGMFPMPSPGSRPSFADVLAGVAASAAPTSQQPQISEDARRSTAPTAPSLGDLAAQQGAADETTSSTAPPTANEAAGTPAGEREASAAMLQLQMQGVAPPQPKTFQAIATPTRRRFNVSFTGGRAQDQPTPAMPAQATIQSLEAQLALLRAQLPPQDSQPQDPAVSQI